MITWKLRKGAAYKKGHPWAFAKDLEIEADRVQPGSFVRIVSDKNEVLDFGYGNPRCALAFRSLPLLQHPKLAAMASVGPGSADFQAWVRESIVAAWKRRESLGFRGSYRLVFSEADGLPGLILDRYELAGDQPGEIGQVLAAQILTAGFDRIWGDGLELMRGVVELKGGDWAKTVVVERKDVSIRKVEGLEVLAPRVLHAGAGWTPEKLAHASVRMASQAPGDDSYVTLTADLFEGQKTGFFLDQSWNMRLVQGLLADMKLSRLRVLDLCSYVGHWSLQLGNLARRQGADFHADLVDVSASALARASANLSAAGLASAAFELDVLKDIDAWPKGPYDVVIADPPAFVKAKKDLPQGQHAYLKLNTEAAKRVAPGGLLISCSCSGAVSEEDLAQAVAKAAARVGRRATILGRGQQGADHPWLTNFPEGRYLKMQITRLD
ncbi:MAG: class I SAM-dependent rRNA methyltransferase [Bdellovibrionaceae bacterium]|nr:class I SAM-dependent rRNA methyltransferase [Pseudobdellovibrionaceae bacterium]